MEFYLDPRREGDPTALPDAEVFYRTATALAIDGWLDADGDVLGEGWYWWSCFPGCLPDSDPDGPFASQEDAVTEARNARAWFPLGEERAIAT